MRATEAARGFKVPLLLSHGGIASVAPLRYCGAMQPAPSDVWPIPLPDGRSVSAVTRLPAGGAPAPWVVLYAPGAGSNLHDPFGATFCRALAEAGLAAVRFQFPYTEAGSKRPDPPALLEATWRAAVEACRPLGTRVAVTGRSMGGRIASMAVAKGMAVDALGLFAYPLHPPAKPEQPRTAHLPQVAVPTLFCCGTRDTFGTPDELTAAAALVPGATLHLLDGADHGFAVLKSSGRTRTDVYAEVLQTFLDWLPA